MKMMTKYNEKTRIPLDPLEYDLLEQHATNLPTNLAAQEMTPFPLWTSLKKKTTKHTALRVSTQTNTVANVLKPHDSSTCLTDSC